MTAGNDKSELTSDAFIDKLRRALRRDGDFPASAKVVAELRKLVSDPNTTANQITELILREPSLGTRVLHLVNSSFYRRAKPIMTVSQAVVQIGMRPLAELCAGLVLLQRFVPAARKGGVFAQCLQKTITTSLLASSINSEMSAIHKEQNTETGYLAGTFFEMGAMLLAFYFPKIYEAAVKRSETKQQELGKSIQELTGLSALQLSLEVIDALDLPTFYKEVLLAAESGEPVASNANAAFPAKQGSPILLSQALYAAHTISDILLRDVGKDVLDKALVKISARVKLDQAVLGKALSTLQEQFKTHCASLELHLPVLPDYVDSYSAEVSLRSDSPAPAEKEVAEAKVTDLFAQYVEEIRDAVENREPTASVITSVMETLAWSLHFDRVMLMLVSQGKQTLRGRMGLGQLGEIQPDSIVRSIGRDAASTAPDALAVRESRSVFHGDPLISDGWPFAAIPIGYGSRLIGIIYADRIDKGDGELSGKEQAAIGVLAELLDRSISLNS